MVIENVNFVMSTSVRLRQTTYVYVASSSSYNFSQSLTVQ